MLIRNSKLPKRLELISLLKAKRGLLPPSIPPEFIASAILRAMESGDGSSTAVQTPIDTQLAGIRPGPTAASQYHQLIFKTLSEVFDPALRNGKIEQGINGGQKRIDIVYRNRATHGFFFDLNAQHRIICPYIFGECKNYSRDIKNPEFDQLGGRFNDRRGRFGILVCRHILDKNRALEACKHILNAGNRIIVLEDCDIIALVECKNTGGMDAVDEFMERKHRDILM